MIREPYIGMPIFIGGTPGSQTGQNPPSRPSQPSQPVRPSMPVQPSQPSQPAPDSGTPQGEGFDARLLGSLPIAMAYVPMQQWKTTYSPAEALMRGTIFPELDLPFEGGMRA